MKAVAAATALALTLAAGSASARQVAAPPSELDCATQTGGEPAMAYAVGSGRVFFTVARASGGGVVVRRLSWSVGRREERPITLSIEFNAAANRWSPVSATVSLQGGVQGADGAPPAEYVLELDGNVVGRWPYDADLLGMGQGTTSFRTIAQLRTADRPEVLEALGRATRVSALIYSSSGEVLARVDGALLTPSDWGVFKTHKLPELVERTSAPTGQCIPAPIVTAVTPKP